MTIHCSTVRKTINLFIAKGYVFEAMLNPKKPFQMIDDRLRRRLLSARLLQEWAPFSIRERAEMIRRLWNV